VGRAALELVRGEQPALDAAAIRPASGLVAGASSQRVRIVDATLACLARQGMAKTTLDDVARTAGCSRATVYRVFPGGKDALMAAVVDTEISRLYSELAVRMGEATELEDVLVAGMCSATARISAHGALRFLLEHEPEVVLPHLAFEHHDEVLASAAAFAAPFLGRWLDHDEAMRVAEWAIRIVLSYLSLPAPGVDLTDAACTRRIVRTYVLPAIRILSPGPGLTVVEETATTAAGTCHLTHRLVPVQGHTADKGEAQ
jgi:AcrR family transcriptional regulator